MAGIDYALHPLWEASSRSKACDTAVVQFSNPSCGGESLCNLLRGTAFHLAMGVPPVGAQLNIVCWDGVRLMDDVGSCVIAHARTDFGNSGGPWLDATGCVVAVHAGAYYYIGQDGCEQSICGRGARVERRRLLEMLDMLLARSSSAASNTDPAASNTDPAASNTDHAASNTDPAAACRCTMV